MKKKFYYFTILSNWLSGYDKYSRTYSKANIKESSFPNEFYLLNENQLSIGLDKANNLLKKTNVKNDCIIRICAEFSDDQIQVNTKNNKGFIHNKNFIKVSSVALVENNSFKDLTVEDLTAQAYLLNPEGFKSYRDLKPRSISFLPVAQACQAKCWFCFSESSISLEKKYQEINFTQLDNYLKQSKKLGAERFVITGGGEPGLLKWNDLIQVISLGKKYFNKIVLITNGMFLSYKINDLKEKITELEKAGLSVLSISRHSYCEEVNQKIMGVDTRATKLMKALNDLKTSLKIRLICVLQEQGISNEKEISQYLDYASSLGVEEICFKELYIASSLESIYSNASENKYCQNFQVPLNLIINFLEKNNFTKVNELPWGSPIFEGVWNKKLIKIAAYTEPSVGWERSNGICRSWNIMADMKNYANLEDLNSLIEEEL